MLRRPRRGNFTHANKLKAAAVSSKELGSGTLLTPNAEKFPVMMAVICDRVSAWLKMAVSSSWPSKYSLPTVLPTAKLAPPALWPVA